jgi:hypothetical protein
MTISAQGDVLGSYAEIGTRDARFAQDAAFSAA